MLCVEGEGEALCFALSLSRTYLAGRSHLATRVLFLLPAGIRTAFDFVDERGISDWGFWLWDDYALSRQVLLWVEKIVRGLIIA